MSNFTLKIQTPSVHSEFVEYKRLETRSHSAYVTILLLLFLVILTILTLRNYFVNDEFSAKDQHSFVLLSFPFCLHGLCYLFSRKWLVFTEFAGGALLLGNLVSVLFLSYSGVVEPQTSNMRETTLYAGVIMYFFALCLMNTSLIPQSVTRIIIHLPETAISMHALYKANASEESFVQNFLIFASATFFLEVVSAYVPLKAQTKLFLNMKVINLQQTSLFTILDTVPDKVMICSQVTEGQTTRAVYNNREMRDFFGCNLVHKKLDKKKESSKKKLNNRRSVTKVKNKLNEKLFK